MKLIAARVQNYRSILDTGWFDIEERKTILVGPNEAGKTVILKALQQLNPPDDVLKLVPLRDYPRSKYNADIQSKKTPLDSIPVVTAKFSLEKEDLEAIDPNLKDAKYVVTINLDNSFTHHFEDGPPTELYSEKMHKKLIRLAKNVDQHRRKMASEPVISRSEKEVVEDLISEFKAEETTTSSEFSKKIRQWLESISSDFDEDNLEQKKSYQALMQSTKTEETKRKLLEKLHERLPKFVYFDNYIRVRPALHLGFLADRVDHGDEDEKRYDYGNLCLLKFLGFDPRELSNLGDSKFDSDAPEQFENNRMPRDERDQQLNAASARLTREIKEVWRPDPARAEAATLRVKADGQYLKVVVEDDLGVEVDFDQRSAGYQWLVSFFVVFFAETEGKHTNTILLLDEPGLSLHGLKQREFRHTISKLSEKNQTLYTTHSPFLVGPDELHLVRVVEMTKYEEGTIVHQTVLGKDPAAIFPLQEALGYDLAQSLFAQKRNLVLEGLTDYWYFDATVRLLADGGFDGPREKIALVPAGAAGKVVYFVSILHAHNLKVAALLDSDKAGNDAAMQDTLVHQLKNEKIIRTADVCQGNIKAPEIEDLLRKTLASVAKHEFKWDIDALIEKYPDRPIISIFREQNFDEFSKYRLAKAYLRWTSTSHASDLAESERVAWKKLIQRVNKALK